MRRSGLERLYLRYCYELGYLPKYTQKPTRLHILLKEDLLKCEQYSKQARLLSENHIETGVELEAHEEKLATKMNALLNERDEYRKLVKRAVPEVEKETAKERITALTKSIKMIRSDMKLCEDIKSRSIHVKENLEVIDKEQANQKGVRKR